MSDRRSGLQKSVSVIFAGSPMPDEARRPCVQSGHPLLIAPSDGADAEPVQIAPANHETPLLQEDQSLEHFIESVGSSKETGDKTVDPDPPTGLPSRTRRIIARLFNIT